MSEDFLNYGELLADAMRYVVKKTLKHTEEYGLLHGHYFYITFDTQYPQVSIPDWLRKDFPEAMNIVLQHKFWNLHVAEDHFQVELHFNQTPCDLVIPFSSILSFADPSVNFSLQFQAFEDDVSEEEVDTYLEEIEETMEEKLKNMDTELSMQRKNEEKEAQKNGEPKSKKNDAKKDKPNKKSKVNKKSNVIELNQFRKKKE